MANLSIKTGQTIETQDGRIGVVRYVGPLEIAAGEWLGLELPDNSGKNDGSVKGKRYFQCEPGYGIFVRKESAVKVVNKPAPAPAASTPRSNGVPASTSSLSKPRPSSGITPDVARKRQSLMGSGASSGGASRLSVRSPTKSPNKMGPPSVSSVSSTPRTGTPATTARTSDSSNKSSRLSVSGKSHMPPPSTTRTTPAASRQSVGGSVTKTTTRPASVSSRQSTGGSRLSTQITLPSRPERNWPLVEEDAIKSPSTDEQSVQQEEYLSPTENAMAEEEEEADPPPQPVAKTSVRAPPVRPTPSGSRPAPAPVSDPAPEERARQTAVIKQLETKVRTLQKQRQEDQEAIQGIQGLQSQTTRYEGIIQTLQKKLKANQSDMAELKAKYEDAEARAARVPDRSAEQETELELATLDKEMAEEKADMFETELQELKIKHEELELELEILKDENRELTSVMSPEEKASAGWLQMERENDRLRQALTMLRDMFYQKEGEWKDEVNELHETLDDLQKTSAKYEEVAAKLSKAEQTVEHLRDQVDAAETNEDVVEALGAEKEQLQHKIEALQRQIQESEEHIQVADELEAFHVEEEKRLHYQLDERSALLNERLRQTEDQEKVIEDLNYTLIKFRDVVQGLQSDINELRRTRDISEQEAHDLSSKSRAMMDLNLKLQSSAAKTQLKTIDMELGKVRAEQASSHLEILQLFVPEAFAVDRKPVLAFLCFKRIKSKATLTKTMLSEQLRDRTDLVADSPLVLFAVMERLDMISTLCDRFIRFIESCSTDDFMRFGGAPYELEPVEQAVTNWVEALRRDEILRDDNDHLQRMGGILLDMAEKLIPENNETKATDLLGSIRMVESYADSVANRTQILAKAIQAKLGPPQAEDEDSLLFDQKMDQLGIKARTAKYLSGKVGSSLNELRARSMGLGEQTWPLFADAERSSEIVSRLTHSMGDVVLQALSHIDDDVELSYTELINRVTTAVQSTLQSTGGEVTESEDAFDILAKHLQQLQSRIEELNNKSADINLAIEFERLPAPWVMRAKEVKAQKVMSQDLQDELARLKLRIQEQTIRISEKDKQLEEQQVKIELLESRAKETKMKDDGVRALKAEIDQLSADKNDAVEELERLRTDYDTLSRTREAEKLDFEALKQNKIADGQVALGHVDETMALHLKAEADLLKVEIVSLQAAVRFLKAENDQLRVPASEMALKAAQNSWLDPRNLQPMNRAVGAAQIKTQSKDILHGLMELARCAKPVQLMDQTSGASPVKPSVRKRTKDTTTYQVLRQKEELEMWKRQKDDLAKRVRLLDRPKQPKKGLAALPSLSATVVVPEGGGAWRSKDQKQALKENMGHDFEGENLGDGVRVVE